MKICIKLLLLIITVSNSFSQPIISGKIGGFGNQNCYAVSNSQGDVFMTGATEGQVTVDSVTHYVSGWSDIYIARISSTGSILWYKQFGSYNPDWEGFYEAPGGMKIDQTSQVIYITGVCKESIHIDTFNVPAASAFLIKFRYDGSVDWIRWAASSYLGSGGAQIAAGDVDISNPLLIKWFFSSRNEFTLDSQNYPAGAYIVEMQPTGVIQTCQQVMQGVDALHIETTDKEYLFVGNSWNDTIYYLDTMYVSNENGHGIFAKYDSSLNLVMHLECGEVGIATASSASLDEDGSVYGSGGFMGAIKIGNDTFHALSPLILDSFLFKADSLGNLLWFRNSNSNGAYGSYLFDMTAVRAGVFYATGHFSGEALFGAISVSAYAVEDAFIAKYDTSGNCIGVIHFGEAEGWCIEYKDASNLLLGGWFNNTLVLGADTVTSINGFDAIAITVDTILTSLVEPLQRVNNGLLIYANPSNGRCRIDVPEVLYGSKDLILRIYQENGQLLNEYQISQDNWSVPIDITSSPAGIYPVVLTDGKNIFNGRIIFQ